MSGHLSIIPFPQRWRTRLVVSLLAAAIVLAAGLSLLGLPSWILLLVAPLPWMLVLGSRRGIGLAMASTVLLSFWLLLAVMMLTTAFGLPLLGTVVVVWLLLGLWGTFQCLRNPGVIRLPSLPGIATWAPAGLGGMLWLGAVAATNIVPGASRLSWVMLGDSANNVIFAREIIYRGGVGLGPDANPVPLPSALMAIVMASGRDRVAPSSLTEHDISAFAQIWMILIALTCLLVGAAAASVTRAAVARPVVIAAVSAGASLLPLSWFMTGYPLEFGFFNTHVALPVVMVSFIAYLASERHLAVALSMQLFAATLLLAIWSPLVLLPLFLVLAILLRGWREVLATRRGDLWLLLLALGQLGVYGLVVVLPSLVAQSHFLSAPGGAFGFRRWMIAGLALAAVALAVATFRKLRSLVVTGTIATVLACGVGLGALLFITRNSENPWSYYPLKFAWLGAVIVTVLIVGLAAAFVSKYLRRFWLTWVGLAAVAVCTVAFLNWAPSSGAGYVWREPIARLLTGDFLGDGDQVADQILALATPEQAHVLWQSGNTFEGSINFWVLQLWSDSMTENLDLKYFAYGLYDPDKTEDLCSIVELMGGDVVVHTANRGLGAELQDACPIIAPGIEIRIKD